MSPDENAAPEAQPAAAEKVELPKEKRTQAPLRIRPAPPPKSVESKSRKKLSKNKKEGDGLKGPAPVREYKSTDHIMRRVMIDKVVINIGVGTAGEELQKAETVIGLITGGRKSVRTMSKTTNKDFDVRKNAPIGCKVTLRGKEAEKFLQAAFWVRDSKITGYSFDHQGNFSFGISDYTDFPGMRYDPQIGVHGMDICVTMKRPGRRVSQRRQRAAAVGRGHLLTPAETKEYIKQRFQVEVL